MIASWILIPALWKNNSNKNEIFFLKAHILMLNQRYIIIHYNLSRYWQANKLYTIKTCRKKKKFRKFVFGTLKKYSWTGSKHGYILFTGEKSRIRIRIKMKLSLSTEYSTRSLICRWKQKREPGLKHVFSIFKSLLDFIFCKFI